MHILSKGHPSTKVHVPPLGKIMSYSSDSLSIHPIYNRDINGCKIIEQVLGQVNKQSIKHYYNSLSWSQGQLLPFVKAFYLYLYISVCFSVAYHGGKLYFYILFIVLALLGYNLILTTNLNRNHNWYQKKGLLLWNDFSILNMSVLSCYKA